MTDEYKKSANLSWAALAHWAGVTLASIAAFLFMVVWSDVQATKADIQAVKQYISERYASNEDIREVKASLQRIEDKLDQKADKK
jgi:uncharacterized tellurite resistance protein B-like protein